MLKKQSVYKCDGCGNIIESLWNGEASVTCCGAPLLNLKPNSTEALTEKHVPVIERDGNRVTVKVGQVAHPMAEDHYILFVEIVDGKNIYRRDFHEGDQKAEAVFLVEGTNLKARAYCNLHGFWETTV